MRYTVVWSVAAEDQLAEIWLASAHRGAVTAASHAVETQLANQPDSSGTPLHEGLYSIEISPLRVIYAVEDADRLVKILRVSSDEAPPVDPRSNGQVHAPG